MKEAMEHIDKAYSLIRQIFVREDDVDRMMIARQELQAAYAILKESTANKKKGDEKNG